LALLQNDDGRDLTVAAMTTAIRMDQQFGRETGGETGGATGGQTGGVTAGTHGLQAPPHIAEKPLLARAKPAANSRPPPLTESIWLEFNSYIR